MLNGSGPVQGGVSPPARGGASRSEAEGFGRLLDRNAAAVDEAAARVEQETNEAISQGLTQLGLSMMAQLGNELIREIKEAENEE